MKTSSRSWSCELDEERSMLEIKSSLWTYKGVSNKLRPNYFDLVDYLHGCWVNKINIC